MRRRMVGAKLDCPAQTGDGLVLSSLGHRQYTQIEMGLGVAWIDGQRLPVAIEGFGRAAQAYERISQPDQGIRRFEA